jgi:hypothetical protein
MTDEQKENRRAVAGCSWAIAERLDKFVIPLLESLEEARLACHDEKISNDVLKAIKRLKKSTNDLYGIRSRISKQLLDEETKGTPK